MPIAFSMVYELVKPEKQGKMQALFAAVSGLSLILGPIIGAYLTDHISWRWVFWINVPLGAVATLLTAIFYKEAKVRHKVSVDYKGSAALAFAIAPLMLALVMGGKDFAWSSWQIIMLFALSLIFTYVFIRFERKAAEPIIALTLFNKKVVSSTALVFLQGFMMVAVMIYIPFYIQGVLSGSATHVGTVVTHMIVAMILGTAIGGHLLEKLPARSMMIASVILLAIGSYLLTQIDAKTTDMYFFVAMVIIGLGMGPLMPTTTLLAQTSVSEQHITSVTSLLSFFRNIGMAVGSSLLAVIVNSKVLRAVGVAKSENLSTDQIKLLNDPNLLMDPKLQTLIPPRALHVLQEGLSIGIVQVFFVTIAASLIMFLFSLLAGKGRLIAQNGGKKLGFH